MISAPYKLWAAFRIQEDAITKATYELLGNVNK